MQRTHDCSRGVKADEAKVDYFGEEGRIRANVIYMASAPDRVRFGVSAFGVAVSTLTSDGKDFALFDMRDRVFLRGPANTCNMARFTRVPVPPHALVTLLRGEAPILKHDPATATLEWQSGGFLGLGRGRYVIELSGSHESRERITLSPHPDDWERPWEEQRVRVLSVRVEQQGIELYHADLADHRTVTTAPPFHDDGGVEADLPPSGPACDAELPRSVHLAVAGTQQDLILHNRVVVHNPPLRGDSFRQTTPEGVRFHYAHCQ